MAKQDIWPARAAPSEAQEAAGLPLAKAPDPQEIYAQGRKKSIEQLRASLQSALSNSTLRQDSLGELYARRYFKECLDGIMELARTPDIDPEVRRKAYMDVYSIAFGRPATVIRVPGESSVPPTIDMDVEQAVAAAELLGMAATYASLPPEEWPEHIREALDKGGGTMLGQVPGKS